MSVGAPYLPSREQLDVLLINTPIHDYASYPRYASTHTAPLGLLSIASYVRLHGFTAEILDAEYEQLDTPQIEAAVRSASPRWVGLNSFSVNISVVHKLVNALAATGSRLVLGGPHATNTSDDHLRRWFSEAEVAVRGDGERAVLQLLEGVSPSMVSGGIDLRSEAPAQQPVNVDLGSLPLIDRSLSLGEPVARFGKKWFSMTMSRGCVFRCRFCAGSSHSNGQPYRSADLSRTHGELDLLRQLGGNGIRLVDDLPFKGKAPLISFLSEVHERHGGHFSWDVNFPLQYCLTLTGEDWRNLARFGLQNLTFGVEAADQQLRLFLGKRSTDSDLLRVVRLAEESGVGLKLYFIVGTPGELAEQSRATTELATKLALRSNSSPERRCSVFVYKPMPGSSLWADLLTQGYTEEDLLNYTDFELEVTQFQKHAWQSGLWLAELAPKDLAALVDEFYSATEKGLPDDAYPTLQVASDNL